MKRTKNFLLILLLLSLSIPTLFAERDIPKATLKEINKLFKTEINKKVTLQVVAEKLKKTYPPTPPKFSKKEIEQLIKQGEQTALKKQFPNYGKTDYLAEAEEKFKLYSKGEDVSIILRTTETISGRLNKITQGKVQIQGNWISTLDMQEESAARLFPDIHAEVLKKYITKKKREENYRKVKIITLAHNDLIEKIYKKNGYIKRKGKWITQKKFLEQASNWYKNKMAKKLKKNFFKKELMKRGYIYKDGKWNKVLPDVITGTSSLPQTPKSTETTGLAESLTPPEIVTQIEKPKTPKPSETSTTPETSTAIETPKPK
ncbi:MAG: hypothetical protein U9O87_04425 [Verrucomicrobiota bacterium]|nr:hypothetical protein [Verrucomicrobiota bacterium]